eukprot:scaffold78291_cov47-Attheya_sp.AAC.1
MLLPTVEPTSSPSDGPTDLPTSSPTASPTSEPTSTPTDGPSQGPSIEQCINVDIGSCDSFALLVSTSTCSTTLSGASCRIINGKYSNGIGTGNFDGSIASVDDTYTCRNDFKLSCNAIFQARHEYAERFTVLLDNTTLAGGRTLNPGCYYQVAAINTAADTNITLDAKGDPDAVFVIVSDGALGLGANSYVVLENGATYENIFWAIQGAVSNGAGSILQGTTLINGAFTLGANAKLELIYYMSYSSTFEYPIVLFRIDMGWLIFDFRNMSTAMSTRLYFQNESMD